MADDEAPRASVYCSLDEANRGIDYLRVGFGGFSLPEMEERQLRKLFLDFKPMEVTEALDAVIHAGGRRPGPAAISDALKKVRRRHYERSTPPPREWDAATDVTPPEQLGEHIAELRARLEGAHT